MAAASVTAQAKINLVLRVTGRAADGYHDVETLLCRIALADRVTVRLTNGARALECSGPALPAAGLGPVERNLAWRAAVAYHEASRWPAGFAIELEKHIPTAAGLGGGSADAGAVLRALDALNPQPLPAETMQRVAASLGADVPFLTQEASPLARAAGRGDRWTACPALPGRPCILALVDVGVPTAGAYLWVDADRGWHDRVVAAAPSSDAPAVASWDDAARLAHNDFEAAVLWRLPAVRDALLFLRAAAQAADPGAFALLSGSGSASYAILPGQTGEAPPFPQAPRGVRLVRTRTAERVEAVHLSD